MSQEQSDQPMGWIKWMQALFKHSWDTLACSPNVLVKFECTAYPALVSAFLMTMTSIAQWYLQVKILAPKRSFQKSGSVSVILLERNDRQFGARQLLPSPERTPPQKRQDGVAEGMPSIRRKLFRSCTDS
jgi:hypothetical protein